MEIVDPTFKIFLKKAANYCVYQERTQEMVRQKLIDLAANPELIEEVIYHLVLENFINEERFAKTFASSKFRIKHWGRIKIKFELKRHGLSIYCIEKALKEISQEDYVEKISLLIAKKMHELRNAQNPKPKVFNYLISKGFESQLINAYLYQKP
jgi:regulatory protein